MNLILGDMEKEVVEIYREVVLYKPHYYDRHSPYEVKMTVEIIFVNIWWKRFINFLLSPFTTYRIDDFRSKLYNISASKPNFEYSNIETEYFENYVEKQKERLDKWFKSSESNEILKQELIKYKYKNRLW